jgi:hypothetical protein
LEVLAVLVAEYSKYPTLGHFAVPGDTTSPATHVKKTRTLTGTSLGVLITFESTLMVTVVVENAVPAPSDGSAITGATKNSAMTRDIIA